MLVAANGLMAQGNPFTCGPEDMKGSFATEPVGTILGGPLAGPFVAVGLLNFDGVGTFSGTASSSFSGAIIYPFPASGPYTVTSDCFVHVDEVSFNIIFEGYFTRDKNEVVFVEPQAGTITTNVLHRLLIRNCSDFNLSDNWTIQATGTVIGTGQFAQNGLLKFDGRGHVSGKTVSSIFGTIVDDNVTGTYAVNKDCTFTATLSGGLTGGANIFGVLYGFGNEFYFDYSAAPPASYLPTGLTIAGTGRQAVPSFPGFGF